jgi:hypothetical protein
MWWKSELLRVGPVFGQLLFARASLQDDLRFRDHAAELHGVDRQGHGARLTILQVSHQLRPASVVPAVIAPQLAGLPAGISIALAPTHWPLAPSCMSDSTSFANPTHIMRAGDAASMARVPRKSRADLQFRGAACEVITRYFETILIRTAGFRRYGRD